MKRDIGCNHKDDGRGIDGVLRKLGASRVPNKLIIPRCSCDILLQGREMHTDVERNYKLQHVVRLRAAIARRPAARKKHPQAAGARE
eukprot:6207472-Pleurochrysis_carterae.AAC.9